MMSMLRKSQIVARGWNNQMIRRFLGEPHERRPNPWHTDGQMLCLYEEAVVLACEQTPEWLKEMARVAKERRKVVARHYNGNKERGPNGWYRHRDWEDEYYALLDPGGHIDIDSDAAFDVATAIVLDDDDTFMGDAAASREFGKQEEVARADRSSVAERIHAIDCMRDLVLLGAARRLVEQAEEVVKGGV